MAKAAVVLDRDPDLADRVLADNLSLNDAYQIVLDRKKDAENLARDRERRRRRLRELTVTGRWPDADVCHIRYSRNCRRRSDPQ